jgi:hypothetical protein
MKARMNRLRTEKRATAIGALVEVVGTSQFRSLNVTQLRDLDKTLLIDDNDKPLDVLPKYAHSMAMQDEMQA